MQTRKSSLESGLSFTIALSSLVPVPVGSLCDKPGTFLHSLVSLLLESEGHSEPSPEDTSCVYFPPSMLVNKRHFVHPGAITFVMLGVGFIVRGPWYPFSMTESFRKLLVANN